MTSAATTTRSVPTYCYQCVAGPDLLTVKVQNGVATEVEPNLCAAKIHPGGGKVCVKAFGLVQKTYNPNRILAPMKRSNPRKGRNEEDHKGGQRMTPGDPADTCLVTWLSRVTNATACARAGCVGDGGVLERCEP